MGIHKSSQTDHYWRNNLKEGAIHSVQFYIVTALLGLFRNAWWIKVIPYRRVVYYYAYKLPLFLSSLKLSFLVNTVE